MTRKLLISVAILVASITLGLIRITAQRSAASPNAARQNQPTSETPQLPPNQQQQQPQTQSNVPGSNQSASQPGVNVTITNQPTADLSQGQPRYEPQTQSSNTLTNWLIALFTGILAVYTVRLWSVAGQQAEILGSQAKTLDATLAANKIIERAYVSMSHRPQGLILVDNPTGSPHDLRITIRLANGGHTPADIIGSDVSVAIAQPVPNPQKPPVPSGDPTNFIMPNDHIDVWYNFPISLEQRNQITEIAHDRLPVLVIGWIIYRDRFGRRHRTGYGRRTIEPVHPGENNTLAFIAEPGYNYEEDLD